MSNYDYTDFIINTINRILIKHFGMLKGIDELNVFESVNKAFADIINEVKPLYKRLASRTYAQYLTNKLEEDWVDFILTSYDDVAKVIFENEYDRRRARLIETIIASPTKAEDIDIAMRSLGRVFKIYADQITDKTTLKAYEDLGIEYVRWETEDDEKVCDVCRGRDGEIYPLKEVPSKPHPNCRCWYVRADL